MANGLTAMQADFVAGVSKGFPPYAAAERAGSKNPGAAAHSWLRLPKVRDAIRERRQARLHGDLAQTALDTLEDLMGPDTPAATRYQAATWVLKESGHGGQAAGDQAANDKPLTEMSAEELMNAVHSGREALEEIARGLVDTHVVDGQVHQVRDVTPVEDLSFLD